MKSSKFKVSRRSFQDRRVKVMRDGFGFDRDGLNAAGGKARDGQRDERSEELHFGEIEVARMRTKCV
jgi:hypothetical protein